MPGQILTVEDTALNDSDKTLALEATKDRINRVLAIWVSLTSSATAGNRAMAVQFLSGSDILYEGVAGAVQAASLTYLYGFGLGNGLSGSVVENRLNVSLPDLWLPKGATVRVFDSAAVDAAADDMSVRISYETARMSQPL